MQTLFCTLQSVGATLKFTSRSSKSNQLFSFSQQYIYACLVKIYPLNQKTTHGNPILHISFRPKTPKSNQLFASSQQCTICKFGQNTSISSEDNRNHISDISKCSCDLEIRSRAPKYNQLISPSQLCIYASLVKIHPLVQKIAHRKEATRTWTPKGIAPK